MTTLAEVDRLALAAQKGAKGDVRRLLSELAWIPEVVSMKHLRTAERRGLSRDDLRQEASLAVLACLSGWDPARGSFRSLAYSHATWGVMNALNSAFTVSMSRAMVSRFDAKNRGVKWQCHGRYSEEVETAMTLAMQTPTALDKPHLESGESYGSMLADRTDSGYEDAAARAVVKRAIRRARNMLTDREREMLAMFYGSPQMRQVEIARTLGVTNQQVANLHQSALAKLRGVTKGEEVVA